MDGRTIEVFEGDSRAARQALRLVTEGQVCLGFRSSGFRLSTLGFRFRSGLLGLGCRL